MQSHSIPTQLLADLVHVVDDSIGSIVSEMMDGLELESDESNALSARGRNPSPGSLVYRYRLLRGSSTILTGQLTHRGEAPTLFRVGLVLASGAHEWIRYDMDAAALAAARAGVLGAERARLKAEQAKWAFEAMERLFPRFLDLLLRRMSLSARAEAILYDCEEQ